MDSINKGFWVSVHRFFVVTGTEDPKILYIAGSILAIALLLWLFWFYRRLRQLKRELRSLAIELKKVDSLDSQQTSLSPTHTFENFPGLHEVWRETSARIVWLSAQHGLRAAFMGSPRDLWTPPRLLAGRLNLNMAEAVPNLLVGIGLLFTFLFLTLALAGATAALAGQGGGQTQLLEATRELLRTAGGKFVTSLAGLLASVLWTIAAKLQMASLESCCDGVLNELDRLAPFTGSEKALTAQFAQFGAMREKLEAQHITALAAAEIATGHKALSEDLVASAAELIAVTEEQSATFKRFSTDLAVSMGTAIDTALAPRFEAMTQQLVGALDKLTERIGTINQDSLDRMAQEHAKRLAEATKVEMLEFKTALVELAGQLSAAGSAINSGAGEAAKSIEGAGNTLIAQMGESGATFTADMAAASKAVLDAAAASSGQLDTAGKRIAEGAAAAGEQMVAAMNGAGETLRDKIDSAAIRLQVAGEHAATSIDTASGSMSRHGEALAATMEAKVAQCAQALDHSSASIDHAMTEVMRRLGEAAEQASQQWAEGVTSAVDLLTQGADRAAGVLGDSTEQAAKTFDASAADLARNAQNFGTVMSQKLADVATATKAMNLEVQSIAKAAHQLAEQGTAGATRFNEALARTGQMVTMMGELSKDWETLVAGLRSAAQDVRATTVPFSALVSSMTAVSTELTARAPQALSAIDQVVALLTESAKQTREAMESSRAAMVDTSNTLHKTVASMRTGVESYSGQVATLHQQLDSALSKAIRDINGSITNMSQAVEALNDSFDRLPMPA